MDKDHPAERVKVKHMANHRYEVVKELGRGGFGRVEEVRDEEGNRYARKTFAPADNIPTAAHPRLRERFQREVKIQQQLGGAEIMPVLDQDLESRKPWFVMPLADKTYDTQIAEDRQRKRVDRRALADILSGLERLHRLGYTHRDLNPKNILFHDGAWKLSDLGAILPPSGQTVTLTEGTTIYTEQYCSPEQHKEFHNAKAPADIYSFGCILHDICVGTLRTPYCRHSAPGINVFSAIIEKCTEINPAKRPPISVLRELLFEALVEGDNELRVQDPKAGEWLLRFATIKDWTDEDFEDFARFFAQLDLSEVTSGHEHYYVMSHSTPFLTRIPVEVMTQIAKRQDGSSSAIIEKYCDWVESSSFMFEFSDSICLRLTAIFDDGEVSDKANAFLALVHMAETHNRWFVMRQMLSRCGPDTSSDLTMRLAIELKVRQVEYNFRRCVKEVSWPMTSLAHDLAKLCE